MLPELRAFDFGLGLDMRPVSRTNSERRTLSEQSDGGSDGLRQNPFMDRHRAEAGNGTGLDISSFRYVGGVDHFRSGEK